MRRSTSLIILAALAAMFLSACAGTVKNNARVDIAMDQNRQAYADSIYGQMSMDDWLDTTIRQEQNEVATTLWRKAKEEVLAGRLASARQCIDLAQELSVNNSYTKAKLINASDYRITILDGPFAGKVLEPGASTSEEKVPIGTLSFQAISASSRGKDMVVTIVRQVVAGQKTIVTVNKKY